MGQYKKKSRPQKCAGFFRKSQVCLVFSVLHIYGVWGQPAHFLNFNILPCLPIQGKDLRFTCPYGTHVLRCCGITNPTDNEEYCEMREKLLALLREEYPDIDFEESDELVDDGILDSLTVVGVISAISDEFNVEIPYEEIIPENFNSIDAMAELIEKYQ